MDAFASPPPLVLGPDRNERSLACADGRVSGFGPASAPAAGAARLECDGCVISPGDVNAHTHLYSGLAPLGMPAPAEAPAGLLQILERTWWRLDRALDADALRAAARLYVAEALLAGTTTLVDHHESPNFIEGSLDVLADACEQLGMRALLCYGATERNGGRAEARRGLAECRRFIEKNQRPLVRGLVGLHASFTVSDETLSEAGELARELGTVVHVHLAEDGCDVDDARRRGYAGPLERLLALDALPAGSILAHGLHLDEARVRQCAEHGLWLVHNPRSNRHNGLGWAGALHASARVALGTDGFPADMQTEELALFEGTARASGDLRGEALQNAHRAASLRRGAGRELAGERFRPLWFALDSGAAADARVRRGRDLRHAVVAGRVVVQDGRLLTGNGDEIRAEAREQAAALWRRMAAL